VRQQCNSSHATTYRPDDGSCETETCCGVVDEEHEIGEVKPELAQKAALLTVFLCMCVCMYVGLYIYKYIHTYIHTYIHRAMHLVHYAVMLSQ
jgi:hypothetical protein